MSQKQRGFCYLVLRLVGFNSRRLHHFFIGLPELFFHTRAFYCSNVRIPMISH